MWPLYDPSLYQPPSPTKRMTTAEFADSVAELEHKPDVDNVFEIMSMLRGQESIRPLKMTFRRFFCHPFMLLPATVFVACMAIIAYKAAGGAPHGAQLENARQEVTSYALVVAATPFPFWLFGMVLILFGIRATLRDKDPEVVQMRAAAAASIASMAVHPKYVHELFTANDCAFLRKLLRGRSRDAERALVVLTSKESEAAEPDPEFRGPRERRL